jgi:GNAT superfamily N-acetyltransferase
MDKLAGGDFQIAPVARTDVGELRRLIHALADYEKLAHLCHCSEADLIEALFCERPRVEALIVRVAGVEGTVAFALYFHNFSTFLGRPGLYLEDIFVEPRYRGRGIGRALIIHLARLAVARRCGRFEWSVLDWNTSAQEFYRSLGATMLPDWRITRITGAALDALAAQS